MRSEAQTSPVLALLEREIDQFTRLRDIARNKRGELSREYEEASMDVKRYESYLLDLERGRIALRDAWGQTQK